MNNPSRRLYQLILRLHPADFRNQFGREMALDFEDALHTFGSASLWRDVFWSLLRQWSTHLLWNRRPALPRTSSLFAGTYLSIADAPYTPFELSRGLLCSATLLVFCCLGLQTAGKPVAGTSANYALRTPLSPRDVNSEAAPPSPGPQAGACGPVPRAATGEAQPDLTLFHPAGPQFSYEVATIKPMDFNAANAVVKLPPGVSISPFTIRRYIMNAYGANYPAQVVGGPDWLDKDPYTILGKAPETVEATLQEMKFQDRRDQTRTMQQCLLADRFHLQAHFEIRSLPVYELVPAKGGLKLSAVPPPPENKPGDQPAPPRPGSALPPGTSMMSVNSFGLRVLKGRAIQLELLARSIATDAGDRPIVNHTGFHGYLDIDELTWAPLTANPADTPPDAPSLARALHTTLGIDLVPGKAPIEVLVIDSIDRPSEN